MKTDSPRKNIKYPNSLDVKIYSNTPSTVIGIAGYTIEAKNSNIATEKSISNLGLPLCSLNERIAVAYHIQPQAQ